MMSYPRRPVSHVVLLLILMAASGANAALQVIDIADCRVQSEAERLDWVAADPTIVGTLCLECNAAPWYIHANDMKTLTSWMRWQYPDVVFRGLSAPQVGCGKRETVDKRQGAFLSQSGQQVIGWLIRSEGDLLTGCIPSAEQLSFTKVTDGCPVTDEPNASRTAVLQTQATWQCGPGSAGSSQTCLEWPKEDFLDDGQAMSFKCSTGFSLDARLPRRDQANMGFTRTCAGGVLGAASATCVQVATSGEDLVDFCDDASRAAWCASRTDEF